MERVLVLYSSPAGEDPLRLDIEDRWTQLARQKHGPTAAEFTRRHATTLRDLVDSITDQIRYTVIVFSGHGTPEGFLVEDESNSIAVLVPYNELAALVAREQPALKVALFMSCESMDSSDVLRPAAPFVVLVDGLADDRMAARFAAEFMDGLLSGKSVEHTFYLAQRTMTILESAGKSPYYLQSVQLLTRLLRRSDETTPGVVQAHVVSGRGYQTLLVDIRDAIDSLAQLGIDIAEFSESVSRKIFLHSALFEMPRQNVYLPVGKYLGLFSWNNAVDILVCHDVFMFSAEVSAEDVAALVELLVRYNDWSNLEYRRVNNPASDLNRPLIREAARHARGTLRFLAETQEPKHSGTWTRVAADYNVTTGAMRAACALIDEAITNEQGSNVVQHLEFALSSVHDLIISCVRTLTRSSATS